MDFYEQELIKAMGFLKKVIWVCVGFGFLFMATIPFLDNQMARGLMLFDVWLIFELATYQTVFLNKTADELRRYWGES